MRARKRFPITVECKHCKGRGRLEKTRPVIPCMHCKHDVHYEHSIEEGWTSTPGMYGWDSYFHCLVDNCKCSHKVPRDASERSFARGEWPHP